MNPFYGQVALRAAHRCEYCRAPEVVFNSAFEVEHVIPASREGPSREDNFALSCRSCNAHKATRTAAVDARTGETARLFHPRTDRWADHFQVNRETAHVEGLTDVGRTTAECLQMNGDLQCAARAYWVRLGLFP